MDVRDLLASPHPPPPTFATGFADLDRHTRGGPAAGQFWLITGAAGQGRTTLAAQLAVRMAVEHGLPTHAGFPRERPDLVCERLRAVVTGRPLERCGHDAALGEHQQVQVARLEASELWVECGGGGFGDMASSGPRTAPACWVVDDAHGGGASFLDELRAASRQGAIVVATAPSDVVLDARGRVLPSWSAADVVVGLDLRHDTPLTGADVEVVLHRNRLGPPATLTWIDSTSRGLFHDHPDES